MIKRGDTIETHENGWIVSRSGVSVAVVVYRGISQVVAVHSPYCVSDTRYETHTLPKIRSVIPVYQLSKVESALLLDFMQWQAKLGSLRFPSLESWEGARIRLRNKRETDRIVKAKNYPPRARNYANV